MNGRPLTILSVAYPFAPVSPDAVGGAEQILSHLDRALVAAGHRSLVVACDGSRPAGKLIATPAPAGTITDEARAWVHAQHRQNIVRALDEHTVDVVHLHGIDFDAYLPPAGVPALVTLHLPPSWYPPEAFHVARPGTHLICVSRTQQCACPPLETGPLAVIENGVPVQELAAGARHARRNFAVALGRICPEKNFHVALDAGARAGVPVLLGGEVFPYEVHERYFAGEICPRLGNGSRSRFLGPVGFARKRRLLSAARCLVSASLAPETSCLVAMEAIACGTPVVAIPSGAVAEIVEDGKTGFFVQNDAAEMAEAIRACERLDPDVCHETARRRFSLEAMTGRYFAAYEELAAGAKAITHAA